MPRPAAVCAHTSSRSAPLDGLLLSGFTGEVWFEPGVTVDEARRTAGLGQLAPTTSGGDRARARRRQRHLDPRARRALRTAGAATASRCSSSTRRRTRSCRSSSGRSPRSSSPGFVRIVRGGGDVGAYLTEHPAHRARPHHRRRADVRRDRVGAVDGAGCRGHRAAQAREPSEAQEADHRRARRRLADHRRAGRVDRRRPAVPGRAHRDHAAAELRPQLHRRAGRAAQRRLAAARRLPRRPAHRVRGRAATVGLVPAQRPRSWRPRHPTTPTRRGAQTAPARSSRSARTTTPPRIETTEYFAPVLGVVSLPGNGQEFLDARGRPRQRQAHRHARRQRAHRPRDAGRARRRVRATRSPTCATARSRSTPGRRSAT